MDRDGEDSLSFDFVPPNARPTPNYRQPKEQPKMIDMEQEIDELHEENDELHKKISILSQQRELAEQKLSNALRELTELRTKFKYMGFDV